MNQACSCHGCRCSQEGLSQLKWIKLLLFGIFLVVVVSAGFCCFTLNAIATQFDTASSNIQTDMRGLKDIVSEVTKRYSLVIPMTLPPVAQQEYPTDKKDRWPQAK